VLFTVCLFFCSSESFEKLGLLPEKKNWRKKIWANLKIEKINAITEDPDSIMLVVKQKKMKFIDSCDKIGGTHTTPTMAFVGHISQGARAFPIVIDSEKATTLKEVTVPSDARIWMRKNATELRELDGNATTPAAATGARTRSQRGATAKETFPPPGPRTLRDGCGSNR
jgi:hypothetical protein